MDLLISRAHYKQFCELRTGDPDFASITGESIIIKNFVIFVATGYLVTSFFVLFLFDTQMLI